MFVMVVFVVLVGCVSIDSGWIMFLDIGFLVEISCICFGILYVCVNDYVSFGFGMVYVYVQDNVCLFVDQVVIVNGECLKMFGLDGMVVVLFKLVFNM